MDEAEIVAKLEPGGIYCVRFPNMTDPSNARIMCDELEANVPGVKIIALIGDSLQFVQPSDSDSFVRAVEDIVVRTMRGLCDDFAQVRGTGFYRSEPVASGPAKTIV